MKFEDFIRRRLAVKKKPDNNMAKALMKLAEIRLNDVEKLTTATLKVESYYEIIKELTTALMSLKGYKPYSHECFVYFLEEYYESFDKSEVKLIDQMRVIRNDIVYRGVFVEDDYLERNLGKIILVIKKLKERVNEDLRGMNLD